jgi:hypothetical protein
VNHKPSPLFPEIAAPDTPHARNDHLTFRANLERGRHGWLRLTPAYSVQLVEELVAQCGKEDVVLDPFCGTGTTALVCAQAGIPCHTVDINPFLVWLTNAKCALYTHQSMSFKQRQALPTLFEMSADERLRATFHRIAAEVLRSAGEPVAASSTQAFLGDSRQLARILPPGRYTTVITSCSAPY